LAVHCVGLCRDENAYMTYTFLYERSQIAKSSVFKFVFELIQVSSLLQIVHHYFLMNRLQELEEDQMVPFIPIIAQSLALVHDCSQFLQAFKENHYHSFTLTFATRCLELCDGERHPDIIITKNFFGSLCFSIFFDECVKVERFAMDAVDAILQLGKSVDINAKITHVLRNW
jgi:hypothetical protein